MTQPVTKDLGCGEFGFSRGTPNAFQRLNCHSSHKRLRLRGSTLATPTQKGRCMRVAAKDWSPCVFQSYDHTPAIFGESYKRNR
jgi:hypothetical protein